MKSVLRDPPRAGSGSQVLLSGLQVSAATAERKAASSASLPALIIGVDSI